MKTMQQMVTGNVQTLNIQRYSNVSSPFYTMMYVSMMIDILRNKRDYEHEIVDIMLLIKRLNKMGFKIPIELINLSVSVTQVDMDNITGLSDKEIRIYCTNRWKSI